VAALKCADQREALLQGAMKFAAESCIVLHSAARHAAWLPCSVPSLQGSTAGRQDNNLQKMNAPLPFCVYVLQSANDGGLYIGFTTNLMRRLEEHNSSTSAATACRRPFELIFCEYYRSKPDALRREVYLKTSSGRRALKLMLQESLPRPPSSLSG